MPKPTLNSPLVSTEWLADHLGDEKLVVLDATVLPYTQPNGRAGYLSGHEQYLVGGHIPGAIFADLVEEFSDPDGTYPFTRPDQARFEEAAASVGIDNDTSVVVYDSVTGQWASRVWWLFRAFGYDSVAVLDGGFRKWTSEGRRSDIGHVEPTPAKFTAVPQTGLWAEKSDVEAILDGSAAGALVCGIPEREFTGDAGNRQRLGHIPGSTSVPIARLIDKETNTLLSTAEIREAFGSTAGSERIVTYCAGGIAATSDALALTVLGHTNVAVYDGSLNEWVADPAAPVVTGA